MRGQAIQAAGDEGYSLARRLPYLSGVFPVAGHAGREDRYIQVPTSSYAWGLHPLICRPTSFVAVTSSAQEPLQYRHVGIHASQLSPKTRGNSTRLAESFPALQEPGTQTFDVAVVVEVQQTTRRRQ